MKIKVISRLERIVAGCARQVDSPSERERRQRELVHDTLLPRELQQLIACDGDALAKVLRGARRRGTVYETYV